MAAALIRTATQNDVTEIARLFTVLGFPTAADALAFYRQLGYEQTSIRLAKVFTPCD